MNLKNNFVSTVIGIADLSVRVEQDNIKYNVTHVRRYFGGRKVR